MLKNKISLILLLILATYSGCDQEYLETTNPNKLTPDKFFKTGQDAVSATNAAYSPLNSGLVYARTYPQVLDAMSDDVEVTGNIAGFRQIANYTLGSDNENVVKLWSGLYLGVFRANVALDRIPPITMDDNLKKRLLAECRFLRAYYYFELSTLWGQVPLITTTPVENFSFPRAPLSEINQLIEDDLKIAIADLPTKAEYATGDLGRATQGAAKGFLGKFYLYQKRYADAAAVLKEIIDSGEYRLMDNYRDNHTINTENNAESLFEVQFESNILGGNTWGDESGGEGNFYSVEYGLTGNNNYKVSQQMADLMGDDPRSRFTFYQQGMLYKNLAGVDVPFDALVNGRATRKYNQLDTRGNEGDGGDSGVNFRLLRFSDILLMYAEAVNELNGPTPEVYAAVNRVRNRPSVAVGDLPAGLSKAEMFNAIVRERALEFALEQIRAKDIRRWGIAGPILRAQGKSYRDGIHDLLPIPQKEIDANSAINSGDQNLGY